MSTFLLISIFILPVLLLSSPVFIFVQKKRTDIANFYVLVLSGFQLVILLTAWGKEQQEGALDAYNLMILMLGLAMVLGQLIAFKQTQDKYFLYFAGIISLFTTGVIFVSLYII